MVTKFERIRQIASTGDIDALAEYFADNMWLCCNPAIYDDCARFCKDCFAVLLREEDRETE